jgi:hypothetical protein
MARRAEAVAWPASRANGGELVPRRRDGVYGVEIDSESVLYDERSGRLHLLNWSASAVWWSIDGIASANELASDLAATFDASQESMHADVLGLLAMLGARDLVERVANDSRRSTDG